MTLIKKYFLFVLLLVGFSSCTLFPNKYSRKFSYLTIDVVHNNQAKMQKFADIEQYFLAHWQSDSTCYTRYIGYTNPKRLLAWDGAVQEYEIVNILTSPDYDTAVVFISWFSCCFDDNEGTNVTAPIVLIKNVLTQQWAFACYKPHFELSWDSRGIKLVSMTKSAKYLMARSAYLTKDNTIDSTFAYRVLTDNYIWFDTMEENMEKGRLLRKSKDDYYNYLKSKHPNEHFSNE